MLELVHPQSVQSQITQTTPYTVITHAHGRYPVIAGDTFYHNGRAYQINTTEKSGVRLDILRPIVEELDAMLSSYSRVFLSRFDLRLPDGTAVEESNKWVRQLFKKLRERLKSKTKRPEGVTSPINEFAFSWVRERHEVEKDHYHCWIALPHRQINRLGGRSYGVGSAIIDIWCQLTGGEHTLVHLAKKKAEYPNHYVIERGQPETLEGPIYWLSYLAKVRGKYQTGKYDRVHSTSQLRNRITRSRNN
ncbi:YagK/YfjJ domain-containing protein [Escherichia coli]|uniref:YagK/YfjJ domain-containing protein n=1 Tax=Escherichia coli TaxID=562 RepID=UPI000CFCED1B|nr:inovirus-type Gp2 protein [Escherichia coli]EFO3785335.1 inovirus Gp2 family protein [Escherichia coli]EFO3789673.1 inovirus Gp2 family protein [Escherichia coli]MBZ9497826.1 inovirus-type Gp2 protein [Escherichia coli]NNT85662.1 inovirus-type Gp2 protein [Escherichia coli]WGC38003.1 inovirus Gp2 family protein [Escherichia coli]